MSERTYPLPSGDELSIEANESVWLRTGDLKGLISDSSLLIEVLALVDSLQQQVKELQEGNKSACESREIAVKSMRETCITSNQHYAKVVELVDQLAERDRTIARQSAALETATDALNGILNGEWSETIDDQFLEVFTTRRINPSQIADEALLEINRELEALGE